MTDKAVPATVSDEMKMGSFFGDLGGKIVGKAAGDAWDNLEIDGVKGKDKDRIVPALTKMGAGFAVLAVAVDYAEAQKHGKTLVDSFGELSKGTEMPKDVKDVGTVLENLGKVASNFAAFAAKAAPAASGLQSSIRGELIKSGADQVGAGCTELLGYIRDIQANLSKKK